MIFRFNTAQLGAKMEKALNTLLAEMQKTQKEEIVVIPDEFPYKMIVLAANGVEAKIFWDADAGIYKFVGEPLPVSQPDPNEKVGIIKDWQRPEPEPVEIRNASDIPKAEPAPEIKITVDSVVSQFMALPDEHRTEFMKIVWSKMGQE